MCLYILIPQIHVHTYIYINTIFYYPAAITAISLVFLSHAPMYTSIRYKPTVLTIDRFPTLLFVSTVMRIRRGLGAFENIQTLKCLIIWKFIGSCSTCSGQQLYNLSMSCSRQYCSWNVPYVDLHMRLCCIYSELSRCTRPLATYRDTTDREPLDLGLST